MAYLNRPYMIRNSWLTPEEYHQLLTNAPENANSNVPPIKPQPGEIYIYCHEINHQDWKSDQYRWRQKGTKNLPTNKPIVTCHYYDCTDSNNQFKRRAYVVYDNESKYSKVTVIHYVGNETEVPKQNSVHGNSTKNKRPHVMTAKSQLQRQKKAIGQKPKHVYRQLTCETNQHPLLAPVVTPKNPKQVSNTIASEQNRKLPSHDDIVGIFAIHLELEGFVQKLELVPNFILVLFSKKCLEFCKDSASYISPVFYYDTTFDLGDFYVSTLIYRNAIFESEPCFPVAYVVHDKKYADVHTAFFSHLFKMFPDILGKTIVTDREEGIRKAISSVLPNNDHVFCWNHIQQDVKNWLRKQTAVEASNIKIYVNNVWDLLDSESLEEMQEKYKEMSVRWSAPFKMYFDKFLFKDIVQSFKSVLVRLNVYTSRSGVTINPSESINALLKRFLNRTEVNLQVLTLSLYQLDKFYQLEILRGQCGLGEMKLKQDVVEHFNINLEDVEFPQGVVPLETLPYAFENQDMPISKPAETPYTNYGVAKMIVLQGRVRHIPEEKCFIVSGDEKKYLVRLFPVESCTCVIRKNCHHLQAVKLSVGQVEKKRKRVKLQSIIKKSRGFKSGKKFAPKIATEVIPADDSRVLESTVDCDNDLIAINVPTANAASKIIKSRLVLSSKRKNKLEDLEDMEKSVLRKDNVELMVIEKKPIAMKPNACSTPIPMSDSSSDSEFNSIARDTFDDDFSRNRNFKIFGQLIFPSNLDCLTITSTRDPTKLYLNDCVISTYISAVEYEERKNNTSVELVTCEGICNFPDDLEFTFDFSLRYFIEHLIPEKDIVIIPVVYQNHCTLMVVLIKKHMILYLDSLLGCVPPKSILNLFLNLYDNASMILEKVPDASSFTVFRPKDIPIQYTNFDCGLYCCLFGEIILRRSTDILQFHETQNMFGYRQHIYGKLISYMKKSKSLHVPVKSKKYNKKKVENHKVEIKSYDIEIKDKLPSNQETVNFMQEIVDTYWNETSTTCHCTKCVHPSGALVCCDWCHHWYHLQCVGVEDKKILARSINVKNVTIILLNKSSMARKSTL